MTDSKMMNKSVWMPYFVCFSAALFFAYELIQMHMMNAISPFLMRDLSLKATDFGYLSSTYLLADVIFLLPAGILLDRFSIRKVILSALGFCILGTFGFAFSQTFAQAAICHFLSGIGNAFCFISCMTLIAKWFKPEKQAFIVGLVITVGMLGGVIAQSPLSLLSEAVGWRAALCIDAFVGLGVLALIYTYVYDSPSYVQKQDDLSIEAPTISFWEGIKRSLLNTQNIACGLYTSLMNMPLMIIGAVYGSLFLTQIHHLSLTKASFIVSMICMGTIFGSPTFGYISDKIQKRRPVMFVGGIFSLFIMLSIMFLPTSSKAILTALFFLLGFFTSSQVIGYPTITESNPRELTGTSMGIAAVIIMGLPMFLGPLCGILMDLTWDKTLIDGSPIYSASNFIIAFSMFPICFCIAMLAAKLVKEPSLEKHSIASTS